MGNTTKQDMTLKLDRDRKLVYEYIRKIFPENEKGGFGTSMSGGVILERKIANRFRKEGCYVVRSAGSFGHFDLVVVVPDRWVFLMQAKMGYERWNNPFPSFHPIYCIVLRRVTNSWVIDIR